MAIDRLPSVAVIGLGSIGLRHARNLIAEGVAVRGHDPEQSRQTMLADAGGTFYLNRQAALEGADAAVIASPPAHHQEDMLAALHAGCHIFVEKPIATSIEGLKIVLDAARARKRLIFVGLNLRLHPAVQQARHHILQGTIGRPLWARLITASYLPDWRPHQDYRSGYASDSANGGIMLDLIHEIDLAWHLLGPLTLAGAFAERTGTIEIGGADVADIMLRRPDRTQITVHLDYITRPRRRRTEIAGESGMIEIDLDARRLTQWHADGSCVEQQSFAGTYSDDYVAEIRLFLDSIAGRGNPPCDGIEALDVLSLAIAARDMAANS